MLPPEPSRGDLHRAMAADAETASVPEHGLPWRWELHDAAGAPASVDEQWTSPRFPAQAEAESWLGEVFGELADAGVDQVTLYDGDRAVYGPMSLHP